MPSPASPSRAPSRRSPSPGGPITSYWERTHWPLQALYFLLPILVAYEVGTFWFAPVGDDRLPQIFAESLLNDFFHWFGVTGYYLPGLAVVVVLLCWHLVRQDPWRPEPGLWALMWVEAVVLAVPLFVFMLVLFRQPVAPLPPEGAQGAMAMLAAGEALETGSWQAGLVFSIGAGIYEELLFRLIGIAVLHMVLVDVLALPRSYGAAGAIVLSAVAFALYHFPEPNPWHWTAFLQGFDGAKFLFYTAAGIYFAGIYVLRGFGIVVVVHAMYDVLYVAATHGAG